MGNSLADLTAALFDQLDRLQDATGDAEAQKAEIQRATAIMGISDQITKVAGLQMSAAKLYASHGEKVLNHLPQIGRATPKDASK